MIIESVVWMSFCIYYEARNQPLEAQIMVGHTCLNRSVKRKMTVKEVIQQPKQFSWYSRGFVPLPRETEAFIKAMEAAVKVYFRHYCGMRLGGVDHFYSDDIDTPYWASGMKRLGKVGAFYYFRS